MDLNAVTDSTDWLETPLAGLAPLDSSLRCQVCKETFTTPMITSCSHTFCSLCIRRYLSQEGKCPSCRTPDQEMKLRHNWAVQELVEIWSANRGKIYEFAKTAANDVLHISTDERPKKRRKVDSDAVVVQKSGLEERRSTRSQSKRVASQTSQSMRSVPSTQEEVPDSDAGSVYAESPHTSSRHFQPAEPNDGLVGCPNCRRRMKEALINTHLDKCLQGLIGSPTPPPPPQHQVPVDGTIHAPSHSGGLQAGTIAYTTTKPITSSTPQRLPTINYSLLNESSLRRKLKELGIPNLGNKEVMRKRHIEWVNLWNANCDSLHPVSKPKLLRELDVWERNLGRDERQRQQQQQGGVTGGAGGGSAVMMDKDFDREGYMKKEKEGFEDLIRRARESRKVKASASANANEKEVAGQDSVDVGIESTTTYQHSGRKPIGDGHSSGQLGSAVAQTGDTPMTNGINSHSESADPSAQAAGTQSHMQARTLVPNTPPRTSAPGLPLPHQTIDFVTPEKPGRFQQQQHQQPGQKQALPDESRVEPSQEMFFR